VDDRVEEGEEADQPPDPDQTPEPGEPAERGHRQGDEEDDEGRPAGEMGDVLDRVGGEPGVGASPEEVQERREPGRPERRLQDPADQRRVRQKFARRSMPA
jgi:hypothetical protein